MYARRVPTDESAVPSQPLAPGEASRRLLTAELLAVGTEITVGETRDTNSGEIARWLTDEGVAVLRLTALPDRLEDVRDGFAAALERVDLVVSTGGLGPTPDDLTREAIAACCGEHASIDPVLERWLRGLWARRGMPFPEMNVKQAWLIPSASALANHHGTAPGWWVDRPDGRVVVALPGPPREMRPMWSEHVLPRLRARGLGRDVVVRTYRLAGIGESQVADLLGEDLLRTRNPEVATYARADAVDVRISAVPEEDEDGQRRRSAEELVDEAEARVLAELAPYVWGRGTETWADALGRRLDHLGWTLATLETGTGGTLVTLIGSAPWLRLAEAAALDSRSKADGGEDGEHEAAGHEDRLARAAEAIRQRGGADVGLALDVGAAGNDTAVHIAIATPGGVHVEERLAFLGGQQGRSRAALLAAAALLARLRSEAQEEDLAALR